MNKKDISAGKTGEETNISRREFLIRTGSAVGLAVAAIATGIGFHNRRLVPQMGKVYRIPPFQVPGTEGHMVRANGTDGAAAVRAALEELGGISRFVSSGDNVLVKPNCAFDRPPHLGATTSPPVLEEVVRQCVEAGAKVRVTDSPINDAEGCFDKSGLADATKRGGGGLWLPSSSLFALTRVGGVLDVWETLARPLEWADKVIGVPTVKTHNLCQASLCMKNWYGFLGEGRNKLHQVIHATIADLAAFITPTLVVLDGTRLLVRNGPTGGSPQDVTAGNTVVVGTDQVAIDTCGAELLDIDPASIEYISRAEKAGIGTKDTKKLAFYREINT